MRAVRGGARRPYRVGLACYAALAFLVFAEFQAVVIGLGVVRGDGVPLVLKLTLLVLVTVLPALVCIRLARVGVYVSGAGIRYLGMLGRVELPWSRVADIRAVDFPVKQQLTIVGADGKFHPCPLIFKCSTFVVGGSSPQEIATAVRSLLADQRATTTS